MPENPEVDFGVKIWTRRVHIYLILATERNISLIAVFPTERESRCDAEDDGSRRRATEDECYGRLDEFIGFARSDAHSAL